MARTRIRSRSLQRRDAERQARESRERRKRLLIAGAGLAVVAAAALIVFGALLRSDDKIDRVEGLNTVGRSLGSDTAPILLTVWEDFQCPFCKKANLEALEQVEKQYVATGKVRIEYRHFAFLGNESIQAAQASECAAEQHQFWPYHDILFANQSGENRGAFSDSKLKAFASEIGLDREAFNSCLDSNKYKSAIEKETEQGRSMGVDSTPAFFVNDRRIVGAQPFSVFQQVIEAELSAR